MKKLKICRIATVPFALFGSKKHLEKLTEYGCEVTIVCSHDENFKQLELLNVKAVVPLTIRREISPIKDLISIYKLFRFFRNNSFDIIHSNTPKGGLIVAISAFLARCPVVIHTFTGQRWQTLQGFKKRLLMNCDRVIALLNRKCFADSWSQREFLISSKIIKPEKISCIHEGAFAGIDLNRFDRNAFVSQASSIHSELGTGPKDFIITYVGRVVGDKGVKELVSSYLKLKEEFSNLKLLIVGPREKGGDEVSTQLGKLIDETDGIITTGLSFTPERYLSVSSVFCLPSYREGFPTVVLEAAAMHVPAVVTNIVGNKDTVIDGKTGYHVKVKSVESLTGALRKMIVSTDELELMGKASFERVKQDFTLELVAKKNIEMYSSMLTEEK